MSMEHNRLLARLATLLVADSVSSRDIIGATEEASAKRRRRAVRTRETIERLGPFYIKVGQILATRPDFVSDIMMAELAALQDSVSVAPFELFEQVLQEELGDWRRHFRSIRTDRPLGSASLAQVYRVTMHDGTAAVVKIQRPGTPSAVLADMAALRRLVRLVTKLAPPKQNAIFDVRSTLAVVFDAMRPELDFTVEADTMARAREMTDRFEFVSVPDVILATPRVLVQTLAPGCSIRDARMADFTTEQRQLIGHDLLAFMYHGFFSERLFHADPHPGNIFVHPEAGATVIDWGMVGRLDRVLSSLGLLTLTNVAQNNARGLAQGWIEMGQATDWADIPAFTEDMRRILPQSVTKSLEHLNFGVVLMDVLRSAATHGIRSSSMVGILGKAFANIEGSVRHLTPELSVVGAFEDTLPDIMVDLAGELLSKEETSRLAMDSLLTSNAVLDQSRSLMRALANRDFTVKVGMVPGTGRRESEGSIIPAARLIATGVAAAVVLRMYQKGRRPAAD